MINGHGDEYVGELIANFSSNVWYGADNSALYKHLYSQMYTIERYPDTEAGSLKQLLAEKNRVATNQLLICNGSTEAFYLIANAFSGSKSSIVTPTFSEYADACRIHNHTVQLTNRTDLNTDIKTVKPDLVWICNPNNPDGYCFEATEIKQLLSNYPDSIFVIDQAYIHFTHREISVVNEIRNYPNLIIVQSLTKRHAIPGLRLGYLMASETIISKMNQFRMPWTVNSLAIEAGKFILENIVYVTGHKNPDSDSICAAYGYSEFKNKTSKLPTKPVRLGNVNAETQFILDYFGVKAPDLLETVKLKVEDLDIDTIASIMPNLSLKMAWIIMRDNHIKSLPVVDKNERLVGILSISNLTSSYMEIGDNNILAKSKTSIENILDTLSASSIYINEDCKVFKGKIAVTAMQPESLKEIVDEGDIAIVGDNLLVEKGQNIQIAEKLGFSKCKVSVAVPKNFNYNSIQDLNGLRVATSYPKTVVDYFSSKGISPS